VPIERTVVIDCHIEDVFEHLAREVADPSWPRAGWDPPRRIAWLTGDGVEVAYELEAVWTATRVTRRDAARLSPLRAIARRREVARQLRALKLELERRG